MSSEFLPVVSADSTRSTSISSATTSTSSLAISSRKRWSSHTPSLFASALEALQFALGAVHVGDIGAFVREQVLGVGPALVLFADEVFGRHFDVVEPDFVHFVPAVEQLDRAHGDAGRLHVDQQEADAGLRLAFIAGAHQAEDPVAVLAERGPGLLAVDDVLVALALGLGLDRGEVGAGARLAVALAPPHFAARDAGQEALLLLGSAERHDHRRDHHRAEGHDRGAPARAHSSSNRCCCDGCPARAAEFLRPAVAEPALLAEDLGPALQIVARQIRARCAPCGDISSGRFSATQARICSRNFCSSGVKFKSMRASLC